MVKSVKQVLVYTCQNCGKESVKWMGRCPDCQEWNSFIQKTQSATGAPQPLQSQPQELSGITVQNTGRRTMALAELNRALGGGIVPGSLILISGEPGIGKSTLLLQVAAAMTQDGAQVIYISGEETLHQIKLRAARLGIKGDGLFLVAETNLEAVLGNTDPSKVGLVVVDSIQTMYLASVDAAPGSINQVRDCTVQLMRWAKANSVPVFVTGHVTKEGAIAGPRALEHIVDVVLYLEGENFSNYRVLRSVKNRFGSTNEIAVFEMKAEGMIEVPNPSSAFISQRGIPVAGSAIVPVLEGSRPMLVEIQALTSPTAFGLPRRTANGVDYNRLLLITAVLTRRAGIKLGNQDVIVNVTGGLKIGEPAADLGIALALASSFRDIPLAPETAVVGEIGLTGELRPVPQLERRLAEASHLGLKRCIIPANGAINFNGIKTVAVSSVREAIAAGLAE